MAVTVQDVLSIDVVFTDLELLRNDQEVAACSAAYGSEIITEGGMFVLGSSQSGPVQGRRMHVPRDRMLVESSVHRTRVVRQYPSHIDCVASVVRLMKHAITCTDTPGVVPSSFGFNLELVYDQDTGQDALSYLGQRLFVGASDLHETWEDAGGSGRLFVREGICEWAVALEPRLQARDTTKVFLGLNLHVPETRVPDDGEMEMLLRKLWGRAQNLIENLDGRNHE